MADTILHATGDTSKDRDTICADSALQRFLEDSNCSLLVATPAAGGLSLANEMDAEKQAASRGGPTIVLTKTRAQALTAGNMMSLVTTATLAAGTSPLEGLAAALKCVYAPLLHASDSTGPGARLATVMAELQAGLASELRFVLVPPSISRECDRSRRTLYMSQSYQRLYYPVVLRV